MRLLARYPLLAALCGFLLLFLLVNLLLGHRMGWEGLLLYALLYLLTTRLATRDPSSRPSSPVGRDWPTSGPIGRFGQSGLMLVFAVSGLLSLLNPWQLRQLLRQAWGNWRLRNQAIDAPEQWQGQVRYSAPVQGEWLVYNGGHGAGESHSWELVQQRYALDLLVVDGHMRRHRGRGTDPAEYYCHGLPILAAADGVVIAASDGQRDARWTGWGIIDFTGRSFLGNYLLIQHAANEYMLLAHLLQESIEVKVGQRVRRGQRIARCGHSGHSAEPHLHVHLQDLPDLHAAVGLPLRIDGKLPRLGQRIGSAAADGDAMAT